MCQIGIHPSKVPVRVYTLSARNTIFTLNDHNLVVFFIIHSSSVNLGYIFTLSFFSSLQKEFCLHFISIFHRPKNFARAPQILAAPTAFNTRSPGRQVFYKIDGVLILNFANCFGVISLYDSLSIR